MESKTLEKTEASIPRWQLCEDKRRATYRSGRAPVLLFLVPMFDLRDDLFELSSLSVREVSWLVNAAKSWAQGHIDYAGYCLERQLLPSSADRGKGWRRLVALWSAVCRLYLCDPLGSLRLLADEQEETERLPEARLAEAMAVRLTGDRERAASMLRLLARRDSPLDYRCREQATAWLLESMAFGKPGTYQQIRWLDRRRELHQGVMGVFAAAEYRIIAHAGAVSASVTAEDLLADMDRAPAFERPLLMMLLEDVIPRPLADIDANGELPDVAWDRLDQAF